MNKPLKIAFETLGCKVNQYETEVLIEEFEKSGITIVEMESSSVDVAIINTCTVTNMADRKSRQLIRKAKKRNPNCIVAVIGCYSETNNKEVSEMNEVDIVLGSKDKYSVVDAIFSKLEVKSHECETKEIMDTSFFNEASLSKALDFRSRAYVKIQEGCNRYCSYCIIPYARGQLKSRDIDNILNEVDALVKNGYKEIVLTGINTALYGMEENPNKKYIKLPIENILEEIEKIEGDFRIRLGSLEPTVINKEQVKGLLKYKKLCNHLHLSLQSGSDEVLSRMNRKYNGNDYLDIVKIIREKDPYYGVSADVIVGFPGETEEDFEKTKEIIKHSKLLRTHVFKFSKRKGTVAAGMDLQIDEKVKRERSDSVITFSNQIAKEFNCQQVGTIQEVLIEKYNKEFSFYEGYSRNYIKVYCFQDDLKIGELFQIKIIESYKDGVKGELYV